jgi:hypothetical protein
MVREGVLDTGTLDYVRYLAPYAAFVQREFEARRFPIWNPYLATGVPVIETSPFATLHPFTLLYGILPFEQANSVLAVVRLAPAGLGAFLLARVLGGGIAASLLAGMLFMLSTFHLAFRFHPQPNVSALLPFLLLLSELTLRGASVRRCGAAWALLGALALVGGHAETAVHVFGVAWTYHLMRAASVQHDRRWQSIRRALVFLGASSACALLAATAFVWGHLLAIVESNALHMRRWMLRSLPLVHLFSFVVPVRFGPGVDSAYLGVIALLLAVRGLAGRSPFPAWPWAVIGGTALLIAYDVWPIATLVHSLPLVGHGDHRRLIFVVHLIVALLAARGLAAPAHARVQRGTAVAAGLIAVSLAMLWASGKCPGPIGWLGFPTLMTVPFLFLGIGTVLLSERVRRITRDGWIPLLATVVFIELYAAHGPRPRQDTAALPPLPAPLRVVQGPAQAGRAFIQDNLLAKNVNMLYAVPTIGIYEPAMGRRVAELLGAAGLTPMLDFGMFSDNAPAAGNLRILSLLNVVYLVTAHPLEDPELAGRLEELARTPVAVYRNPHALPRAFVADHARVARDPPAALALLRDPRIDLRRVVVLEQSPDLTLPGTRHRTGSAPGTAEILDYQPGAARIAVSASAGGYLVFSETYHPGWRAQIDGNPVPTLRGDYCLIAVQLPVGTHEVTLRYRPLWLTVGGVISTCTLLVLAGAVILPPRRATTRAARGGPT